MQDQLELYIRLERIVYKFQPLLQHFPFLQHPHLSRTTTNSSHTSHIAHTWLGHMLYTKSKGCYKSLQRMISCWFFRFKQVCTNLTNSKVGTRSFSTQNNNTSHIGRNIQCTIQGLKKAQMRCYFFKKSLVRVGVFCQDSHDLSLKEKDCVLLMA